MAKKTFGLGRGLESLLPDSGDSGIGIMQIPIGELDPNPDQPRQTFDETTIAQLAASIQDQGFLQPLLVVPTPGGRYRIVAGERRYRAGRKAGVDTIPCIVRDLDVTQQMEIALIENLQREDLNPMEAARGIDALKTQCGYTQEKIAARLGMSRPAVANMLRLLTLPDEVTEMVRDGLLTAGHARAEQPGRPDPPGPQGSGRRHERSPAGTAGRIAETRQAGPETESTGNAGGAWGTAGQDPAEDRTEEHTDGKHQQGQDRAAVFDTGRTGAAERRTGYDPGLRGRVSG